MVSVLVAYCVISASCWKINNHNKTKVVLDSITSVGLGADPGFLAVNLQMTLVINPVVG